MGLDIEGSKTKKRYTWSYSALHRVRAMAYYVCGCEDPEVTKLRFFNKEPQAFEFSVAGYTFPNLLLHSDCEGSYTAKGKVLKNKTLTTGNIYGLQKELNILRKKLTNKEMQNIGGYQVFIDLKALVDDEIKLGGNKITFY